MTPAEIREYLDDNPNVFRRFEGEALKVISRGFGHYSARTIMEYLRHNSNLEADPTKMFKINDHLTPTLARDFMQAHPEAPKKFFEMRGARVIAAARDPEQPEPWWT